MTDGNTDTQDIYADAEFIAAPFRTATPLRPFSKRSEDENVKNRRQSPRLHEVRPLLHEKVVCLRQCTGEQDEFKIWISGVNPRRPPVSATSSWKQIGPTSLLKAVSATWTRTTFLPEDNSFCGSSLGAEVRPFPHCPNRSKYFLYHAGCRAWRISDDLILLT